MSMRKMSAGSGYRYLLDSVAKGDLGGGLSYYTAAGTPPGRWLGTGLRALEDGPRLGTRVGDDELRLLFGEGRHPRTGAALGRAYPQYREGAGRRAVAGFDLTFSVPKSVSVLWGVSPVPVQRRIWEAHHRAIVDVLDLVEREVAATRIGTDGVRQVEVSGIIAAGFDHYDSRAGDPQLHTHVVISNKVRTTGDGRWRALDSRPIHAATVALSEHYNAVLADHLTTTLGVGWELRDRGHDRTPAMEIIGVPEEMLAAFSSRTSAIEVEKDRLVADYLAAHGRRPSARVMIRLRQAATLATRPDKVLASLADLTEGWRHRARTLLQEDPGEWTRRLLDRFGRQGPVEHVVGAVGEEQLAAQVVESVGERRATWTHWNLHAEASRRLRTRRFPTARAREEVVAAVVAAAEAMSVSLDAPEIGPVPEQMRRADGTSQLRPRNATRYTAQALLDAEGRLLEHAAATDGPTVAAAVAETGAVLGDGAGRTLGVDQAAAVVDVATSGRRVDLLVGPAGTGKTTALTALRRIWEAQHGVGSVIALAPSAAAANVLAEGLGIATENTAKWLHDRNTLQAGQLVIVDEASLAGTHTLDRIAGQAAEADAKVLLVGDAAQLAAVDAGGAFHLLTSSRPDHPSLVDVRRFTERWEADATLRLRDGNPTVLDDYLANDRIRSGATEEMVKAAHDAWRRDLRDGNESLLIAPTRELVTELNRVARAARQVEGAPAAGGPEVELRDGTVCSIGDRIISRKNDRKLTAGTRWVRNGDRWTVAAVHPDGSLTATPPAGGPTVVLPASYAAAHVQLGYATTIHQAQGRTVDTAHIIITPTTSREQLYVAMTRGRHANTVHVTTDSPAAEAHTDDRREGLGILRDILARTDRDRSAHATMREGQDQTASFRQLTAEYEAIAALDPDVRHSRSHADLVAGVLPRARSNDAVLAGILNARADMLEATADRLAATARREGQAWTRRTAPPPRTGPNALAKWRRGVRTIAAFRNLHEITDDRPLGIRPRGTVDITAVRSVLQPSSPTQPAADQYLRPALRTPNSGPPLGR